MAARDFNFGPRLLACRQFLGRSLSDVSNETGIARTSLSNWETGKTEPGAEAIKRLAQYYGVSADFLLCLVDETKMKGFGTIHMDSSSDGPRPGEEPRPVNHK